MFEKITIIGCGLIGSSILRAVEEKKLASKISAYDKSLQVTDYLKKNFSVETCNNISDVVRDSDLIIIASPLSSYKEILLSIQSNFKENVILTDTGSAKKEVNKIIVAGRGADNLGMQCGGWTINWQGGQGDITVGTTILDGIKKSVSENTDVIYSKDGLDLNSSDGDLAIVVIGEDPYTEFFGDKENLDLMEEDLNTIKNLKDKGYKVLVLLISGRPMNIADHIDNWDGFAALWLPGTEGDGVSDILFGDFQPTGKLSYPWPLNTEEGANALVSDLLFDIGFGL